MKMVIYGTALLACCMLVGIIFGKFLGLLLGIDANLGGVGFAMILLIVVSDRLRQLQLLPPQTEQGILYWSQMYIPIAVAMSASQDVYHAFSSGMISLLAGVLAVLSCFLLVPLLAGNQEKMSEVTGNNQEEQS